MKVSTILDQIDLGSIALPEFQRGYVWNRDQVRGLMRSLYRRHPVGSLLVWVTATDSATARGTGSLSPGFVKLLLDGQQRMTSLYGIIRGIPPKFFDGDVQAFTGLYFNLEDETFEFYAPAKMKGNPTWIDVTRLMKVGPAVAVQPFMTPSFQSVLPTYLTRLNAIDQVKDIDLHVEEVTGEDKTVDVVVDIFNNVNSGGTKLSKGDLALAKICAGWPEARQEMKACLQSWETAGFRFQLDWLLRNVNTIVTGEAMFSALKDVTTSQFRQGLRQAEQAGGYLLNVISTRLGLDHDRVLGGRYAFPVMTRFVVQSGGKFRDARERDRLLHWYIQTFLWGRFTSSVETFLNQDLAVIEQQDGALDRLIDRLRLWRSDLQIRPEDFAAWSLGARFYPLLYLLTRVGGAKNFCDGVPLSAHLLGKLSSLQVHHIFPQALLYEHGCTRPEVNAIANYCFLTQECNLTIAATPPEVYFAKVERDHPGALASQWIPLDPELWKVANYRDFLAARRVLLSQAANSFLDSLLSGAVPEASAPTFVSGAVVPTASPRAAMLVPGGVEGEDEESKLQEVNAWVVQQGLPEGEYMYELSDPVTGSILAILDLAWPIGLQEGLSQPVALLIDEGQETLDATNRAGFRFFTDITAFKAYVEREILARELVAV